jgi:hypothetical protein
MLFLQKISSKLIYGRNPGLWSDKYRLTKYIECLLKGESDWCAALEALVSITNDVDKLSGQPPGRCVVGMSAVATMA